MAGNALFISDLQIPFEAHAALKFCQAVQKEFKIPPEDVYCVGDEVDQYFGSMYKKDPNGWHTATSELQETKLKLKAWYRAFPQMKIAISNHGMRWAKKAWEAEIPSQMMRPYQELIEAPKGWVWKERWIIKGKRDVLLHHGLGYSGQNGHRTAAIDAGMSTVIGHLHAHAGIAFITTENQNIWGLNCGCLIDTEAYAFEYGKYSRFKPTLAVGVVIDKGITPILVPYERF